MNGLVHFDLRMNAYLFGCLVLGAFWLITLIVLRVLRRREDIKEMWWASWFCFWLGVTEPLFVPEYWDPPSIFKVDRWDFESFVFCFFVGGMAAVLTEIPVVKSHLVSVYYALERTFKAVTRFLRKVSGGRIAPRLIESPPSNRLVTREQARIENMLLLAFFVGMLGATAHLGLNIIYDAAITCVAVAGIIAWRRPSLRWQILGGGLTFTVLYGAVLVITGRVYPDFYDHWNHAALSGRSFLGAPIEEYIFAFTFGIFWAPLYEAWREVRN